LSFLLLFAEILCIRWLGCELAVVRIFPNLIVMVALVSTSTGMIAQVTNPGKKSKLDQIVPLALAITILLSSAIFAKPLGLVDLSVRFEGGSNTSIVIAVAIILLLISCIFIIFRRLGVLIAREFDQHKPLVAYSVNLLGSIAGTLAIALSSWLSLGPWAWLILLAAPVFLVSRKWQHVLFIIVFAGLSATTGLKSYWSPYSKLDVIPISAEETTILGPGSFVLNSNNFYFHTGMLVVPEAQEAEFLAKKPITKRDATIQDYYWRTKTPFVVSPSIDEVLVLGAGSGNDGAYALEHGVKRVDSVEIDPVISGFGKTLHPNHPWNDPRARVFNEDARTFLRYTKNKYDLVLFADLDPGATINTSSFLRVDNFVYTIESMRSALRVCKPTGIVVLSFATGPESIITRRIYKAIEAANGGKAPITFVDDKWLSVLYIFGPGIEKVDVNKVTEINPLLRRWPPAGEVIDTKPSSDDWPFLYTNFHKEGMFLYFSILLVAVVVPALLTIITTPKKPALAKDNEGTDKDPSADGKNVAHSLISPGEWGNMFFLGNAFMLIETKSITQLSLLFGATWLVSSIVILTILILAWVGNLIVMRTKRLPLPFLYGGLFFCLLLDYLWRVPEQTTMPPLLVSGLAALFACCPILFGSMTFSTCFKNTSRPVELLSANLLGVAFGGLTENLCLWTGIKGLPILGLALYGLSGLSLVLDEYRRRKAK
jgi:SAM-dependent methyltransferase